MSYFLAFAGFAALIILHEFGHFIAAKACGMRVERFALFFPPLIVKKRIGETEYGIGAIPLGGFVKITGMNPEEELSPDVAPRAYYHQPVWKRIVTISAGPAMNVLIAFLIFFALSFDVIRDSTKVLQVDKPPAVGKLLPGDRIVGVDGKRPAQGSVLHQLMLIRDQVNKHRCPGEPTPGCAAATPVTLTIQRGGRTSTVPIRPRYDPATKRMLVGIAFGEHHNPGVAGAARYARDDIWTVTKGTVNAIARIFNAQDRKQISGVVGSYEVTRQSFAHDTRRALLLLAVISLSLAIINLFPFLPLDGGHIFWSLVEKVRGRPVPYRVMEQAGMLGFVLVLILFYIGLSNDIGRLTGGGFNTR